MQKYDFYLIHAKKKLQEARATSSNKQSYIYNDLAIRYIQIC